MMTSRRHFLSMTGLGAAAAASATSSLLAQNERTPDPGATDASRTLPQNAPTEGGHYRPPHRLGLGGVALGNAFRVTPLKDAEATMETAWAEGIRYFDTSPWYGLGTSERRFGHFLDSQKREDYVLSTKIGRLMIPDKDFTHGMWKGKPGFTYKYDYTAEGTRRSVEDSLQRLGIPSIDIVFIHDLSSDNGDMKERWTEYFEIAAKGAMKELAKMREEGLIKGWGLGVNTIEPILKTLEVADPDIFLSATKYSLIDHEDVLERLFPACEKHGVSIVTGAPLNSGFLAGVERYNYSDKIPPAFAEKRTKLLKIAGEHQVDLRTAAIQFTLAPKVVSATIPGARGAKQVKENVASVSARIPAEFWEALKKEQLIAANAPVPTVTA